MDVLEITMSINRISFSILKNMLVRYTLYYGFGDVTYIFYIAYL